ncbi:hypothetical protein ACIGD1_11395 [Streptomyces sp. NPDC085612]|uniref:DUF6197 family protein n=1 Tax=Streptomyces sp. NPDC085612 TaxID=3365732 RepID=UPI0037D5D442
MTPHNALLLAADVIETAGFHRRYFWDTAQAQSGVPPHLCRVDVSGALAIALHGHPAMVHTPDVRAVEHLLVARLNAPSLAAWYARRPTREQALRLLRDTAHDLRRHP